MEELTEVITAAEFHPNSCNTFVYSSSKGTIRLCDMRASALCDRHSKCECVDFFLKQIGWEMKKLPTLAKKCHHPEKDTIGLIIATQSTILKKLGQHNTFVSPFPQWWLVVGEAGGS